MASPTQRKQPSGQRIGGQWAQQQKEWVEEQDQAAKRKQQAQNDTGGQQGDDRTHDEPMAYPDRDPVRKKTGEF
jgi:hypothetical protein